MPILLDDIASITSKTTRANTPHFFSTYLTGRGTAQGLINQALRPGRYMLGSSVHSTAVNAVNTKTKSSNGSVTVRTIPMGPLTTFSTSEGCAYGLKLGVPSSAQRFHVTASATTLDFDVFLDLTPQGAVLTEDGSGDKITRHLDVLYRMEVFVLAPQSTTDSVALAVTAPIPAVKLSAGSIPAAPRVLTEFSMMDFSYAPLDDAEELIRKATHTYAAVTSGVFVDTGELALWMSDYDLYERICNQADVWSGTEIGRIVSEYIAVLFSSTGVSTAPSAHVLNYLAAQLRYLESYNVPLDAYRQIYNTLRATCPPDIAEILTKQNMNLLMNGTMADLDVLKVAGQLVVPVQTPAALAALPAMYSMQQREAITTAEPLSLTTAGAGTGKSSTILARIDYLMACGVSPREITVLSFTNAAADNILAKCPAVGSMTIARMVLEIYKLNYPTHQISTIDTIVNSLDIFYPNDDMVRAFRRRLVELDKNQEGATTALNAFVEQHFDRVMMVLDRLQQTCLELQIIIAYQQIDTMLEPPHLAGQFLIVDEVQDNSIFEFIYLLRYVSKHKQNMFIVGDASQTLYEFRSANPKALNALEGSGVFKTYRLTTNYRSNQAILDFANVHLADIEANALSGIRLEANSLAQPTAAFFQEHVQLEYRPYKSQKAFREDFPALMRTIVKPYVDECLARGEQVAFLAATKLDVNPLEAILGQLYPSETVANITSKRRRATTIFSVFVKYYWNDVRQAQPADASFVVSRGIVDNLDQLVGPNMAPKVAGFIATMVSDWWIAQASAINGWVALYAAGSLPKDEFFDRLMRNLLEWEIEQNGIKQAVLNQANRERKELNRQSKSKLVVSTIHGAKGLEFDNVVVVHEYDTVLPEDKKRMYYVAFTRAMGSELILSFGSQKFPRIESDYKLIVAALEKREQLDLLRQQGKDVDTMSDDEVEAALAVLLASGVDEEEDVAVAASGDDDDTTSATAAGLTVVPSNGNNIAPFPGGVTEDSSLEDLIAV